MFRRAFSAALAFATLLIAGQAAAQATNYVFTGAPYVTVNNSAGCTVGECATYTTAMRASATFTFAVPLAANLPFADRTGGITAYTFSDGVRTTTGPGPLATTYSVRFATDGTGKPTGVSVTLERTPGPPYAISAPADPNSYISYVVFNDASSQAFANSLCLTRGPSPVAAVSGPGSCTGDNPNAQASTANSTGPTVVTVAAAPAPVPTLSEWAMIMLGLLLAGGAAIYIQRRQFVA